MLEKHIMEGEDADGNTEVEQVEAQTILIVAAVGAVIAVAAAVGLLVLLLKRNKKQHHILLRKNQSCWLQITAIRI